MYDPNPEPFIADTGDRIAARTARAQETIDKKEGFDKTRAQFGLFRANATDRVGSWFNNPDAEVANGVLGGMARGIVIGMCIFAILGAAMGSIAAAPLWIIPAFTVGLALFDGYDAYKFSRSHDGRRDVAAHADNIAIRSGALEKSKTPVASKDIEKHADKISKRLEEAPLRPRDVPNPEDHSQPVKTDSTEMIGEQATRREPGETIDPLPERGPATARLLAERRAQYDHSAPAPDHDGSHGHVKRGGRNF